MTTTAALPIVPTADFLDNDLVDYLHIGGPRRITVLRSEATGTLHIAHDCTQTTFRGEHVQLRTAPPIPARYAVLDTHPLTIRPAFNCPHCGLRGRITHDEWTDA
ncbi:MAG: hypothetical protein AAGA90_07865 [Actinomycetota bacterium]